MALSGIRVLEFAGLAPAPMAGMILSDFGAAVTRIDRIVSSNQDSLCRGKRSISLNLKSPSAPSIVKSLVRNADVLIEPFRPGVMEKLNIGPEQLLQENPRLVFCRLSGFGQQGSNKDRAGHDINYLASSGVLSMLKWGNGKPTPPINILADFAGGGLTAAFGIVAALLERERSGHGQVIDSNLTEGGAYVSSFLYLYRSIFPNPPGKNPLDGGAPFYDTYETKDGKYIAVGALEPQFYANLLKGLAIDPDSLPHQMDMNQWPKLRSIFEETFLQSTRDEWAQVFCNLDACVTPVLSREEAASQDTSSGSFFKDGNMNVAPIPAPRLLRTPATPKTSPQPEVGEHTKDVLLESGFTEEDIKRLIAEKVISVNTSSKL